MRSNEGRNDPRLLAAIAAVKKEENAEASSSRYSMNPCACRRSPPSWWRLIVIGLSIVTFVRLNNPASESSAAVVRTADNNSTTPSLASPAEGSTARVIRNAATPEADKKQNATTNSATAALQFTQCVRETAFRFLHWKPLPKNTTTDTNNESLARFGNYTTPYGNAFRVMAMPQHAPKHPSGFAARCDWVLGSRAVLNQRTLPRFTAWGDLGKDEAVPNIPLPRTVFVQTSNQQKFHDQLLPCFPTTHRFVLITGDYDATTPRQVDVRFHKNKRLKPGTWEAWLADPRILHLFIEHLDVAPPSNRVTPIPVGFNDKEFPQTNRNPDAALLEPPTFTKFRDPTTNNATRLPMAQRPVRIVFTNRVRTGKQWEDREFARNACEQLSHCDVNTDIPREIYGSVLRQEYTFAICAHGGGIEPNPNVFTTILNGVIPIVAPFPGQSMYKDLPVVIMQDDEDDGERQQAAGDENIQSPWKNVDQSKFLTQEFLAQKLRELAPYFDDADKRARVLDTFLSQFWWDKVEAVLAKHDAGASTRSREGPITRLSALDAVRGVFSRKDTG